MNHFVENCLENLSLNQQEISLSQNGYDPNELQALGLQTLCVKPTNGWSRFCRNRILSRFGNIADGQILLDDVEGSYSLGQPSNLAPQVRLSVADPAMYPRTLLGGTIGAAESYMDGQWRTNNLTDLIRILIRNMSQINSLDRTWSRIRNTWNWLQHQLRRNTIDGSKKNIHKHYDLGNDFYRTFLDQSMNYSCGIFPMQDSSMLESSLFKMNWICQKLQLSPSDHVLEIGTGWGGLSLFMAEKFGCRVTTTTISKEQRDFAIQRIEEAGMSDRVKVLLEDYRSLGGKYDKLVSIEMIEAVGHQYFDQYFSKCNELLADDGMLLLQGITMNERNYRQHIRKTDFIRRYIFPGGCLPSLVAIGQSVAKSTDMRMVHLEDITQHYVRTLQQWRCEFFDRIDEIKTLGYENRFIRMWHFYLCYCEAAFAEKRVNTVQMVLAKPGCDVDPANEYSSAIQHSTSHKSEDLGAEKLLQRSES